MKRGTPTWYGIRVESNTVLILHQMAVKNCFIRGSVVRYVQLPADAVDTQLLEDATRRGNFRSIVHRHPLTYPLRNP